MTKEEFFKIARKGSFDGMIVDEDNFEYMIEFLEECKRENKVLQEEIEILTMFIKETTK